LFCCFFTEEEDRRQIGIFIKTETESLAYQQAHIRHLVPWLDQHPCPSEQLHIAPSLELVDAGSNCKQGRNSFHNFAKQHSFASTVRSIGCNPVPAPGLEPLMQMLEVQLGHSLKQ
jgi:hypothetical protein